MYGILVIVHVANVYLTSLECFFKKMAWRRWLMPVTLATQEAEIRRICTV
jgi:hypothetical protein